MLTFRKGGYTKESIKMLREILYNSFENIVKTEECIGRIYLNCKGCKNKPLCDDLYKVIRYLDDID